MARLSKTTLGWWVRLIFTIGFVTYLIWGTVHDLMYFSAGGLAITDVSFLIILCLFAVLNTVQYEIWPLVDNKPWEKKDEHENNSV